MRVNASSLVSGIGLGSLATCERPAPIPGSPSLAAVVSIVAMLALRCLRPPSGIAAALALPPRFLRRGCRPLAARWCTAFHSARGNWRQCFQSPLPLVALAAMVRWCLRAWACPQAARLLASCQRGCCGAEPLGHDGCRWRPYRRVPFCRWPPSGRRSSRLLALGGAIGPGERPDPQATVVHRHFEPLKPAARSMAA